jgi:hypothetical protein
MDSASNDLDSASNSTSNDLDSYSNMDATTDKSR